MNKIQYIFIIYVSLLIVTQSYLPPKLKTKLSYTQEINFKEESQTVHNTNDVLRTDTWWALFSPGKKVEDSNITYQPANLIDYDVKSYKIKGFRSLLTETASESSQTWRGMKTDADILPSIESFIEGTNKLNDYHEKKVQELWNSAKIQYLNTEETELILDALRFSYLALKDKRTERSKELYTERISGTLSVLGELKSTIEVLLPGILHNVISECAQNNNDIKTFISNRFGNNILDKAEKYTKIPKFMARKEDVDPLQSEFKIQMLVSMIEDYHSLYIRLADRVHTLRILHTLNLDATEKYLIAMEGLNVYAPLAHKMGVKDKKGELEDLAFRFIDPEAFEQCKLTQASAFQAYHHICESIKKLVQSNVYLRVQNITASNIKIETRIKDKYQLYLKMHRKGLKSVSDVRDALGLRIIINHPQQAEETAEEYTERGNKLCYHIINKLNTLSGWKPIKNGFKDYIKSTKSNGYQSLHQYIHHDTFNCNVEVQVRTLPMHIKAEMGEAAHWSYKDQIYKPEIANTKYYKQAWKSPEQQHAKSPAEFIKLAKIQLKNNIYIFLKDQSTIQVLKSNSTSLDAAFAIHSEVGLTASSIKVNNRIVDFNYPLKSGQVLSVDTHVEKAVVAKPNWLKLVTSPTAKYSLNRHFKHSHQGIIVSLGIIQLLIVLTTNSEKIKQLYNNRIPSAHELNELTASRTKFSNIAELLMNLGSDSSQKETGILLSSLLAMPSDSLTIPHANTAMLWAKTLGKHGWNDHSILKTVLLPLIKDILPAMGLQLIEQKWCELVGKRSLTEEHSPYFKALSSFIISSDDSSRRPISEIIDTRQVNRVIDEEINNDQEKLIFQ